MHPIFAPVEVTSPDLEDLDHHEILETKERTSAYYPYVSPNKDTHERDLERKRRLLRKLGFSFFLFGLINNGEFLTNNTLDIF